MNKLEKRFVEVEQALNYMMKRMIEREDAVEQTLLDSKKANQTIERLSGEGVKLPKGFFSKFKKPTHKQLELMMAVDISLNCQKILQAQLEFNNNYKNIYHEYKNLCRKLNKEEKYSDLNMDN